MSLFNEEIDTAISFYLTHAHLEMLMKIEQSGRLSSEYRIYLNKILDQEMEAYLDSYGGEIKEEKS